VGMDSDGSYKTALEFARKRNKPQLVMLLENTIRERTETSIASVFKRDNVAVVEITGVISAFHTDIKCDARRIPIRGTRYHKINDNYNLCELEFDQLEQAEKLTYEVLEVENDDPIPFAEYDEDDDDDDDDESAQDLLDKEDDDDGADQALIRVIKKTRKNAEKKDPEIASAIEALPPALARLSGAGLNALRLVRCKLTDNDAVMLFTTLQQNKTAIREINLASNLIGDVGMQAVCELLAGTDGLVTTLDLGMNRITDAGVKDLPETLKPNVTLRGLILGGNPFTPSMFRYLREQLKDHKSLSTSKLVLEIPGASKELFDVAGEKRAVDMKKSAAERCESELEQPNEP